MTTSTMETYLLLLLVKGFVFLQVAYTQAQPNFNEGIVGVRISSSDLLEPQNEGGVEVEFKDTTVASAPSVWLAVCWKSNHDDDEDWGKEEARVVCRQLQYKGGWPFQYLHQSRVDEMAIDDVRCEGDEEHLADCRYDGEGFVGKDSGCGVHNQAGVNCFNKADVRLVDDQINKPNQGNVEVKYDIANSDWMEVCHGQLWSLKNAQVVCSQLGYPGAMSTKRGVYYRLANIYSVGNITCNGDERNIAECLSKDLPRENKCADTNKAEVICFLPGYEGCFTDDDSQQRVLPDFETRDTSMTIIKCHDHCRSKGTNYLFAGLTGGTECRCGTGTALNFILHEPNQKDDEDCSAPCGGDESHTCGGTDTIAIYKVNNNVCYDPGMASNSERTGNSLAFSSILSYSCDEGYELIGEPVLQCIMGDETGTVTWNATVPTCQGLPTSKRPGKPVTLTAVPQLREGSVDHPLDIGLLVGILAAALLLIVLIIATACFAFRRKKAIRRDNIAASDVTGNDMVYPSPVFDPNDEVMDNVYFNPAMPSVDPDYDELSLPVKGGNPDMCSDMMHPPAMPNVYMDPNLHGAGASAMVSPPDYESTFDEKPKKEHY